MSIEKPPDLHAHVIKLEFKYSFKINGYETILGHGTIIVSDQSTDDLPIATVQAKDDPHLLTAPAFDLKAI